MDKAAASQDKEEEQDLHLLHQFQRILHDDPLIDEVGFLHPAQFQSLHLDGNSTSHWWCAHHKLAISSHILPDLYRAARHAHSNATKTAAPHQEPAAAAAAALIMSHSKALLIFCPDSLTAWNSRKMVLSTNYHLKHLQDELHLCALILSYSPKNESTWSHKYLHLLSNCSINYHIMDFTCYYYSFVGPEFYLFFSLPPKHYVDFPSLYYHNIDLKLVPYYRRWVIKKLAQHHHDMSELVDKESLLVKEIAEVLDELKTSTKWTEMDVADNCCFHYHRSLLLALLDSCGVENGEYSLNWQSEAHLLWKEELRWNEMLIRRYQGRESLWIHRRFLSQWWVQHLLSREETCPLTESLVDLFLAQEIHLLSGCLNAPGDEFGEARVQAELAALYILWISKQDAVVKRKVEERLQSEGSLKEVLARACPEKSRLWTHLLHR